MKALLMVAHPDDCIIFGLGIIHHCLHWDWNIGYLTYCSTDPRGREISNFWQKRNIKTHWLGFKDDYRDIEAGAVSFDSAQAEADIADLVSQYQVVATHDPDGDYGHVHHQFVNRCVAKHHAKVIEFSKFGAGNLSVVLPDNLYTVDEIPIHYNSIGNFISPVGRCNEYCIPNNLAI